ncbi:hypothetical protein AA313_de0206940 [Arthrobotrys entomopaga]|nr:hypothetical protein AA313_de0206940 [Arthrobotrys entomopaga]
MPPITNAHLFALSRIIPYTPTSLTRQPPLHPDQFYVPEHEKSKISRRHILDGIATYLSRTENDVSAVAAYRGLNYIKIYYTKTTPFTPADNEALEQLKKVIFENANEGTTTTTTTTSISVHAGYILQQACTNCLPAIISRFEKVHAFRDELGITPDSHEDKFNIICVPDAATVWEYITTLYGSTMLEEKGLKHIIRGLILNGPKKGVRKSTLDSFMYMATLMSRLLVNGFSLWRTGDRHASAGGGSRLAAWDCGIYITKTEFVADDPEGVYRESEELMGRIADAMLGVGVYADAALDLAAHAVRDGHFRRCLKDRQVFFEEVKLPPPSLLEISDKPVEIINKFLGKKKKERITRKDVEENYQVPEERLTGLGAKTSVECNVHCAIFLLMHMVCQEYTSKRGVRRLDVRYGCSKKSCYLCEVYIDELRSRVVGDELERLFARIQESKIKTSTGKNEEGDELANMFSQLKGLTSHHGKTLGRWFSQIGQSEKEDTPKKILVVAGNPTSVLSTSVLSTTAQPQNMVMMEKENAENPGYTRGFRQICAGWQYPANTPDVVKRRMEERVGSIITHIYEFCRPQEQPQSREQEQPEPEEVITFAPADNQTFPGA